MNIRVKKLFNNAILPRYAHSDVCSYPGGGNAGADLFANEEAVIYPGCRVVIGTGIAVEIPLGWEGQVRSKSGLALKQGIQVLNSPGTIDPTYRGEVIVILQNHGDRPFSVKVGDKIAQLVIEKYEVGNFIESDSLEKTERNDRGFGSTDND